MNGNGEGLRALFYGLCLFWDIDVRKAEDPSDPSDFSFPSSPWPVYVVIVPEPAARQVEIASLLSYGNHVIVLDRDDLDDFRARPGGASASFLIGRWTRGQTHAAEARRQLGIGS